MKKLFLLLSIITIGSCTIAMQPQQSKYNREATDKLIILLNSKSSTDYTNDDFGKKIHMLIKKGADPNVQPSNWQAIGSPLWAAVKIKDSKLVLALLQRGANPNEIIPTNDFTLLMRAAFDGNYDIVQSLINHGADFNKVDHRGFTALMYAVKSNKLAIVKLLPESGAGETINVRNIDGLTALQIAQQWGHQDIIKLLEAVKTKSKKLK